jgi:hypothetical protein
MALTSKEVEAGMVEAEVWVAVDCEGNHFVGRDADALVEDCDNNDCNLVRRVVCMTIKLPCPGYSEVAVELPAESGEVSVKVS